MKREPDISRNVKLCLRAAMEPRRAAGLLTGEANHADICAFSLPNPVEIPFLDCLKASHVNNFVVANLFPNLIPGDRPCSRRIAFTNTFAGSR